MAQTLLEVKKIRCFSLGTSWHHLQQVAPPTYTNVIVPIYQRLINLRASTCSTNLALFLAYICNAYVVLPWTFTLGHFLLFTLISLTHMAFGGLRTRVYAIALASVCLSVVINSSHYSQANTAHHSQANTFCIILCVHGH